MTEFQKNIKQIRHLYKILFSKEVKVEISYNGEELGNSTPWLIRIDNREKAHADQELGAMLLLNELKDELKKKISSTRRDLEYLQSNLNTSN